MRGGIPVRVIFDPEACPRTHLRLHRGQNIRKGDVVCGAERFELLTEGQIAGGELSFGIVLDDRGGSLDVSQCGLAGDGVELGRVHRRAAGGELVASV